MQKADFNEREIVEVLREARVTTVAEVAKKRSISEATIHAWQSKFANLSAEEVKRMRHLKTAHAKRRHSSPMTR